MVPLSTCPLLALALAIALLPSRADAHGSMVYPPFRGTLKAGTIMVPQHDDLDDIETDNCPHCLNGGGKGAVMAAAGAAGWTPWEPLNPKLPFRRDSGLCGDPVKNAAPRAHEVGGIYGPSKKMPFTAVYRQGESIKLVADITTNHNGFFEFFICDVSKCGGDISEKCFKGGHCKQLMRTKQPDCESQKIKQCGPIDPAYPGRWYVPCRSGGHVGNHFMGGKYMQYALPKGFTCKHCVIQWYWATANACNPPGMKAYFERFPLPGWQSCPGDGGSIGGVNPTFGTCGGQSFPEEFWMCADVVVTGPGVPKPAVLPRAGKYTTAPPAELAKQVAGIGVSLEVPEDGADDDDDDDDDEERPAAPPKKVSSMGAPAPKAEPPAPAAKPKAMHMKKKVHKHTPAPKMQSAPPKPEAPPAKKEMPPAPPKPQHNVAHAKKKPHTHERARYVEQKPYKAIAKVAPAPAPVSGAATAERCGQAQFRDEQEDVPDPPSAKCASNWKQCGGKTFNGPTECCSASFECVAANPWYAQCKARRRPRPRPRA